MKTELVDSPIKRAVKKSSALKSMAAGLGLKSTASLKAIERALIDMVRASEIFDANWYLKAYPDVGEAGIDPALHFILHGAREKRDPGPNFNTELFLSTRGISGNDSRALLYVLQAGQTWTPSAEYATSESEDVEILRRENELLSRRVAELSANLSLLSGGIESGPVDLVRNSDLFDPEWYKAQYPEIANSGIDLAFHYVINGVHEQRDPGPEFSSAAYLEAYKDVAQSKENPLVHYLQFGRAEGRKVEPSRAPAAPPQQFGYHRKASVTDWVRSVDFSEEAASDGVMLGEHALIRSANCDSGSSEGRQFNYELRTIVLFDLLTRTGGNSLLKLKGGAISGSYVDFASDPANIGADMCSLIGGETSKSRLSDAWFSTDTDLRLRIEAPRGSSEQVVIRAYQADLITGELAQCAEASVSGTGASFVNCSLRNPLSPVLLSMTTPDGRFLSVAILPFPSLCRGGLHYGELLSYPSGNSYATHLGNVSSHLLKTLLLRKTEARGSSIGQVLVDLSHATGVEPVFRSDIRSWLSGLLGVSVSPAEPHVVFNTQRRSYLSQALEEPSITLDRANLPEWRAGGECIMMMPADAIPSISACVDRAGSAGGGKSFNAGSAVVANGLTGRPMELVRTPSDVSSFAALQPAGERVIFPVVSSGDSTAGGGRFDAPMIIRFIDRLRVASSPRLIAPVALDSQSALLRKTAEVDLEGHTITAIIAATSGKPGDLGILLETLGLQSLGAQVNVVLVGDVSEDGPEANLLRRFFPERHQIIPRQPDESRSAMINRAAATAGQGFLFVADETIVLHNERTLETLARLAMETSTATAGCMLIADAGKKKKPDAVNFVGAGLFCSQREDGTAVIANEACLNALSRSVYPTIGNMGAMFMIRVDCWRQLGGLDAERFPEAGADADLGVRAVQGGFWNLCTTIVSAGLNPSSGLDSVSCNVSDIVSDEAALASLADDRAVRIERLKA